MSSGPLAGITVLDLTHYLAGPFGTQLLGDLGARVIKVEPPAGDLTRSVPPYFVGDDSAYFLSTNRNKESVVLDLKIEEGRDLIRSMVAHVDLVVESNRPDVLERLGLGYDALAGINPAIVMVSITGFGKDGPYADRPAYDAIVQALSGVMSLTGEPGAAPVRTGVPIGDLAAGLYGVIGGLAALHEARTTGQGRHVDVSMLDGQISMLSYLGAYYLASGDIPPPQGRGHLSNPVYRSFQAADDQFVMVCANTQKQWEGLCRAIGVERALTDPRFATMGSRNEHREEVWAIVEPAFRTRSVAEWLEPLRVHDVPYAPLQTVDQALTDPQVRHRNMVLSFPEHGCDLIGNPIKVLGNDRDQHRWPPALGSDTAAVVEEFGPVLELGSAR
ncbi:MAG TPA: CoA transferase [Acidimicrobiales bacterium]|jgi:crotonobetainyl-CoA:carnitine CoA-transferase CaiB-like acyl-CoA transferase